MITKDELMTCFMNNTLSERIVLLPYSELIDSVHEVIAFHTQLQEQVFQMDLSNPTWNNTFLTLKKIISSMELLDNFYSQHKNMMGSAYSDKYKALTKQVEKDLFDLKDKISRHEGFILAFKRMLSQENSKKRAIILEKWLKTFFNVGLTLHKKKVNHKLGRILNDKVDRFLDNEAEHTKYQKNYIFIPAHEKHKIEGIAHSICVDARKAAKRFKKDGWMFIKDEYTTASVLAAADNRALRRRMYQAYENSTSGTGEKNNDNILKDILSVKQKIAQNYGEKNYADLVLSPYMLNTPEKAYEYLWKVDSQLQPFVGNIKAKMQALALQDGITQMENWDHEYYYQKLILMEQDEQDFNEMFNEHFVFDEVLPKFQAFLLNHFHLQMTEVKKEYFGSSEVMTYHLFDTQTQKEGYFIFSPFNNEHKVCAYEIDLSSGETIGPNQKMPSICYITLIQDKVEERHLMSPYDLWTMFHEFGHALHAFYAQTDDCLMGASMMAWDLIELPSQYLEHFVYDLDFLQSFSAHQESGEPMDKHALKCLIEAQQKYKTYEIYKDVRRYASQLWIHETFKPHSKKSPTRLVAEKLLGEGMVYNISRDEYMTGDSHMEDYGPTGYVYLFSAQLAAKLFSMKHLDVKKVFTNVFNSAKMEKVEVRLANLLDVQEVNMIEFLQKGLDINLYGEPSEQ